ncbi:Hypothetical predicted protein [Olea europaea subsp. europaea]|uniref:Uncharacterized protein n=2 Tax=Olea europaea subsp. europaea TaxID=158383 RepID=A0A8S0PTI4_OLEEU|nr:Hypothetical predicted protein [Olea europaea subsp. europaea]CAA3002118.1 Hypothetical predicted protein [Olea europaea subsp. europaea]
MWVSENLHQMDSIAGIMLRSLLKPISTKPMGKDDEDEHAKTPTSADSRIPRMLACPPAPKKRKPSSRCHYAGVREFFNPPDLETVFQTLT